MRLILSILFFSFILQLSGCVDSRPCSLESVDYQGDPTICNSLCSRQCIIGYGCYNDCMRRIMPQMRTQKECDMIVYGDGNPLIPDNQKSYCYLQVAFEQSQPDLCEKIPNEEYDSGIDVKDTCFMGSAILKNDRLECEKIPKGLSRNICYQLYDGKDDLCKERIKNRRLASALSDYHFTCALDYQYNIKDEAISQMDTKLCEYIKEGSMHTSTRQECLGGVGMKRFDPSICLLPMDGEDIVESSRNVCLTYIAKVSEGLKLCDMIENVRDYDKCNKSVHEYIQKNEQCRNGSLYWCELFQDQNMLRKIVATGEHTDCVRLKGKFMQMECIRDSAVYKGDETLCHQIHESYWEDRADCFTTMAKIKDDPSLCENLAKVEDRGKCHASYNAFKTLVGVYEDN